MTMVQTPDGVKFDDAQPRFLYAGNGLVFDRCLFQMLDYATTFALYPTAAWYGPGSAALYNYAGVGNAGPVKAAFGTTSALIKTLTFSGGPASAPGRARVVITLTPTETRTSSWTNVTVGQTATVLASLLAPLVPGPNLTGVANTGVLTIAGTAPITSVDTAVLELEGGY